MNVSWTIIIAVAAASATYMGVYSGRGLRRSSHPKYSPWFWVCLDPMWDLVLPGKVTSGVAQCA